MKSLSLNWNLETIFLGGVESAAFASFLRDLNGSIADFATQVDAVSGQGTEAQVADLVPLVTRMQPILLQVRQVDGFVTCLKAENQGDRRAMALAGQVKEVQAHFNAAQTRFDQLLLGAPEAKWREFLAHETVKTVAFSLQERRARAREKLSPAQESLIGELSIDGYHGWSELYLTVVGQLRVPFEENGEIKQLSIGEAENKLNCPDRAARAALFGSFEGAWAHSADFCADALNRIGGFRWRVYQQRGWTSILKEPLDVNGISAATLDAMWQAVRSRQHTLTGFLKCKAQRMGLERLSWHDIEVPLYSGAKTYAYDEAAQLVIAAFSDFDPKMGDFAARALSQGWVDAEMRAGKRNGGFSKTLPLSRESRVFVNFGGSFANVKTLAHELGHAYHQDLMKDLPALAQRHPMTVAETASTFAEQLLARHAWKRAQNAPDRLALLEAKLQSAVNYLMNIAARFEFEQAFYRERKTGAVSVERLNQLSIEAQKAAYGDTLTDYHAYFWAARRHFFFTHQPFYNFPYTFGFLLSAGLTSFAEKAGPEFRDGYLRFLRDSGSMTVEALAAKHLGADLKQPDFWIGATDSVLQDVEGFLKATSASIPEASP